MKTALTVTVVSTKVYSPQYSWGHVVHSSAIHSNSIDVSRSALPLRSRSICSRQLARPAGGHPNRLILPHARDASRDVNNRNWHRAL